MLEDNRRDPVRHYHIRYGTPDRSVTVHACSRAEALSLARDSVGTGVPITVDRFDSTTHATIDDAIDAESVVPVEKSSSS